MVHAKTSNRFDHPANPELVAALGHAVEAGLPVLCGPAVGWWIVPSPQTGWVAIATG